MRVLYIGNSDDVGPAVPKEQKGWWLAARRFEEATGESCEMVPKACWPAPELPDILDRWVTREEPDLVYFKVNGFWYLYPSIPLRLGRMLGPLGKPFEQVGRRVGESWFNRTRVYHLSRRLALRTIGGATYFTPDEVVETVERCLMRLGQREGLGIVLQTQIAPWRQCHEEMEEVHLRLKERCSQLHVQYVGISPYSPETLAMPNYFGSGDRLHAGAAGHEHYADRQAAALIEYWRLRGDTARNGPK